MAADDSFDLVLEREVPCSVDHLWRGWTDAEMLKKWFTPAPWLTVEAEIDLRPGGIFRTVMQGPNGESGGGVGCVLIVEPLVRFAWTSALEPDFRPVVAPADGFLFTAVIELASRPNGALYRATARHATLEDARIHAEMGFHAGWGAALDQLVALSGS